MKVRLPYPFVCVRVCVCVYIYKEFNIWCCWSLRFVSGFALYRPFHPSGENYWYTVWHPDNKSYLKAQNKKQNYAFFKACFWHLVYKTPNPLQLDCAVHLSPCQMTRVLRNFQERVNHLTADDRRSIFRKVVSLNLFVHDVWSYYTVKAEQTNKSIFK